MSARREKRLRALERRVEKLEAVAYMSTFYVTTGEKAQVEFMDAGWTRAPERGPVPCFSAEPARRGPWQRLVDIFRKDR